MKANGGTKEMELKDSKTWENLMTAFAGESQAYTKYQWFAAQAKKDGYCQIANIFNETAGNENVHAKVWFKYLNGGSVPGTMDCLQAAWDGENFEYTDMYANFSKVAAEEGFTEIANRMKLIGDIEMHHRDRFQDMMNLLKDNLMFEKPEEITWICLNCGYTVKSKVAPKICPVCKHPQGWFEELVDYNQNLTKTA